MGGNRGGVAFSHVSAPARADEAIAQHFPKGHWKSVLVVWDFFRERHSHRFFRLKEVSRDAWVSGSDMVPF